jgi:hypothetical protein
VEEDGKYMLKLMVKHISHMQLGYFFPRNKLSSLSCKLLHGKICMRLEWRLFRSAILE